MKIFILLTLFFCVDFVFAFGQLSNDSNFQPPAIQVNSKDTLLVMSGVRSNYQQLIDDILKKNEYIGISQKPVFNSHNKKQPRGKEYSFYLIGSVILVFGFFKVFYSKYFNNIFRVFFNTSLRQNQLADILMQSKLPSLVFNIFFVCTSGLYLWLLLNHFKLTVYDSNTVLIFCVLATSVIYIVKYCVIKFIGWVTDMSDAADVYIFVLFLVNKIIGITLIPFIVLMAFTSSSWIKSSFVFSILIVGLLFLLRFFRTFGLLQHQLNISRIHFSLYIIAIEVLPLFVIYKLFLKLLVADIGKNF